VVPVIAIDGPSGSGKGTIAKLVAQRLGWHYLDSGALYRALGLAVDRHGIDPADPAAVADLARRLDLRFDGERIWLDGEDVSAAIRSEAAGNQASRVAAIPEVRAALLQWQRDYARPPGLVADGRDMGSVVFPRAPLRIFLDASPEERAQRRYNQLKEKGMDVSLPALAEEIRERDARDRGRAAAPLVAAPGAFVLDSTGLSIDQVLARVLAWVGAALPGSLPQ